MPKGVHNNHVGGNYQGSLEERFWKNVKKSNKCECWEWTGTICGVVNKRYGVIRDNYKQKKAHRISYELHKGIIPEGKVIRHICDNKLCVNPDHLQIGSVSDNNRDKIGKHLYIAVKPEKYDEAVALMKKMGYYGHLTNK
jgi:hypothetical protein